MLLSVVQTNINKMSNLSAEMFSLVFNYKHTRNAIFEFKCQIVEDDFYSYMNNTDINTIIDFDNFIDKIINEIGFNSLPLRRFCEVIYTTFKHGSIVFTSEFVKQLSLGYITFEQSEAIIDIYYTIYWEHWSSCN